MHSLSQENIYKLCHTLIHEEGYEPLLELGMKRGIEPHTMVNICDATTDICQYRNEGKARSMAIIVGDKDIFDKILLPSVFELQEDQHINNFRQELNLLAGLVDGRFLALTMNNKGKILGIKRIFESSFGLNYVESAKNINPLYTGNYRHMAIISKMTEALTFYFPPEGNIVKLFDSGRMIAQYTMGDWRKTDYDKFLEAMLITAKKLYTRQHMASPFESSTYRTCLIKVMRVAILMSTSNRGTIFSLDLNLRGDHRNRTNLSTLIYLRKKDVVITDIEDDELLNIASLDGAVLIDGEGQLLEFNAILNPSKTVDTELHYGARHETALNYSASREMAIVLVVSQDGGVIAFNRGEEITELPVIQY